MRIAYVFRHAPAYVRSTKQINSLVAAGHQVTFIGWDLEPDKTRKHEMDPSVKVEILQMPGQFGKQNLSQWIKWWLFLSRHLVFGRFDAVQAVDEVAALMVAPFKFWGFRFLILDVYDSVIKRKAGPVGAVVLNLIRFFANVISDRIIETSDELKETLGCFQKKAVVLFNSPLDPSEFIEGIFPNPSEPVRLAATGAINSDSMALQCLVEALNLCPAGTVEVQCSGWLTDDYAKNVFAKHPAVKYQWIESQVDYYKMIASCDAVYNMRVDSGNSHYRALVFPNKVFDALAVGRPVIVATENWVSKWVRHNQAGLHCSFKDPAALSKILMGLPIQRIKLPALATDSLQLFRSAYSWEIMEKRLKEMYESLARN